MRQKLRKHKQWHALSLNTEDESSKQLQESSDNHHVADNPQDAMTSPHEMIDLWPAQGRDIQTLQHESKDLQPILY